MLSATPTWSTASPSAAPLAGAANEGLPLQQAAAAISPAARIVLMSFLRLFVPPRGARGQVPDSTAGAEFCSAARGRARGVSHGAARIDPHPARYARHPRIKSGA